MDLSCLQEDHPDYKSHNDLENKHFFVLRYMLLGDKSYIF